jgi:hypothetical protein
LKLNLKQNKIIPPLLYHTSLVGYIKNEIENKEKNEKKLISIKKEPFRAPFRNLIPTSRSLLDFGRDKERKVI